VKPSMHVRVLHPMRRVFLVVILAACGGSKPPQPATGGSGDPPGVVADTRSELEKRRDTGCEKLRPRLVQCAIDDAKASLEAGKITKQQFDQDTSSAVREKLGVEWLAACEVPMSSRQVRVLEVCDREESQCGPLTECLANLNAASE
jgi:hypothetical protein